MSGRSRQAWGLALGVVLLGLMTAGIAVASQGHLGLTLAPVLVLALLYATWRLPLRTTLLVLLAVALVVESPAERPGDGMWSTPLLWVGSVLHYNFSATFGVQALPFSGLDMLLAWLLLVAAWQRRQGRLERVPLASCLRAALVAFCAALGVLMAWGLLRGGDATRAYWQVQKLLYLVAFTLLFSQALRGPEDYALLGRLVIGAALVKVASGLCFYFLKVLPRGLSPEYLTTHGDTVLFVGALLVLLVRWLEAPSPATLRHGLLVAPLVGLAILLNDRRIAYVNLLAVLVLCYAVGPRSAARRTLTRAALLSLPLLVLYAAAGWGSSALLFRPVASLRSISDTHQDMSTLLREIENHNLSQTLWRHPVLGTGLGQPYEEVLKGPDVHGTFEDYRYFPHNSVLWLVMVGGLAGLPWLLVPFLVGAWLAARSYQRAQRPGERAAALVSLGAMLIFLTQAYGDMGLHGTASVLLVAVALSVSGKLAMAVGAWPAPGARSARAVKPMQAVVEPACPRPR